MYAKLCTRKVGCALSLGSPHPPSLIYLSAKLAEILIPKFDFMQLAGQSTRKYKLNLKEFLYNACNICIKKYSTRNFNVIIKNTSSRFASSLNEIQTNTESKKIITLRCDDTKYLGLCFTPELAWIYHCA